MNNIDNLTYKIKIIHILGIRLQPAEIFKLLPIAHLRANGYRVFFTDITELKLPISDKFNLIKVDEDNVIYNVSNNLSEFKKYTSTFEPKNTTTIFGGWVVNIEDLLLFLKKENFRTIHLNLLPIGKFNYLSLFLLFLKKKIKKAITPDICIAEGHLKQMLCNAFGIKKIWNFHSPNYEYYLKNKNPINLFPNKKYITYIDQNFISHPDFEWFGINKNDFGGYYEKLNKFFLKIEKKYKLPIIFALHPTSNIQEYKQYFPSFTFEKLKVYELVTHSKYVIAHFSTALEFAIIKNKPVMYINIPRKFSRIIYKNMKTFSRRTKIKPISIFNENKKLKFHLNQKNNKNYINKYIKSKKSENLLFFELFLQKMENNE